MSITRRSGLPVLPLVLLLMALGGPPSGRAARAEEVDTSWEVVPPSGTAGREPAPEPPVINGTPVTEGTLHVKGEEGVTFPLDHTDVRAEISGNLAIVHVTQVFSNPFDRRIEGMYTFPLSHRAAVSGLTMTIGDRVIESDVQTREEARETYLAARDVGQRAALLEQERPNIFNLSVANIRQGETITIEITYQETLDYDHGTFSFLFPMVVAPRYMDGETTGPPSDGSPQPPTTEVPDADRITPPFLPPDVRSGRNISLSVSLDAGIDITEIFCPSHTLRIRRDSMTSAEIALASEEEIPNRDFQLRYRVRGDEIGTAFLTHRSLDDPAGTFLLMLTPMTDADAVPARPHEIVFLVDTSGSMSGQKITQARNLVNAFLPHLSPKDSFNIVRFGNGFTQFRDESVENTTVNQRDARRWIDENLQASGGTQMLAAVDHVLGMERDENRNRIVVFVSDGLVGNDERVIRLVRENRIGNRFFAFNIATAGNHWLMDEIGRISNGYSVEVWPDESLSEHADLFRERISTEALSNISLEWDGVEYAEGFRPDGAGGLEPVFGYSGTNVTEIYPDPIPDLFIESPLLILGMYDGSGDGTLRIRGDVGEEEAVYEIPVSFPVENLDNEVLPYLWARRKIDYLTDEEREAAIEGDEEALEAAREAITAVALNHHLTSQYTSLVVVENAELLRALRAPAEIEVRAGNFTEALDGVSEALGVPVDYDGELDFKWSARFDGTSPREVLDMLAENTGLRWIVDVDRVLFIRPEDWVPLEHVRIPAYWPEGMDWVMGGGPWLVAPGYGNGEPYPAEEAGELSPVMGNAPTVDPLSANGRNVGSAQASLHNHAYAPTAPSVAGFTSPPAGRERLMRERLMRRPSSGAYLEGGAVGYARDEINTDISASFEDYSFVDDDGNGRHGRYAYAPAVAADLKVSGDTVFVAAQAIATAFRYPVLIEPGLDAEVNLDLEGVSIEEALDAFATGAGVHWRREGQAVIVTAGQDGRILEGLNAEIPENPGNIPADRVLLSIAREAGFEIVLYGDPAVSICGPYGAGRARDLLTEICDRFGMEWYVSDGRIVAARIEDGLANRGTEALGWILGRVPENDEETLWRALLLVEAGRLNETNLRSLLDRREEGLDGLGVILASELLDRFEDLDAPDGFVPVAPLSLDDYVEESSPGAPDRIDPGLIYALIASNPSGEERRAVERSLASLFYAARTRTGWDAGAVADRGGPSFETTALAALAALRLAGD